MVWSDTEAAVAAASTGGEDREVGGDTAAGGDEMVSPGTVTAEVDLAPVCVGEWTSVVGMLAKLALLVSVGVSLTSLSGSRMLLCGSSIVMSLIPDDEDSMSASSMDMVL